MTYTLPSEPTLDSTTLFSLLSTVAILIAALALSRVVLPSNMATRWRFLFVWHAFDALIHFILEGSFIYHCYFSVAPVPKDGSLYWPDPENYLGSGLTARFRKIHGPQAAPQNALANLWIVYARADRRWAGVDLTVLSIETITVLFAGSLACFVCYDIARRNPRASLSAIILAVAEIYGGYMTFMPEWLSGNINLDTSNWMYKWLFLIFFNGLWVVVPLYSIYVAADDIFEAFRVRQATLGRKKQK